MPDDFMTETDEDKAALTALQNEAPIELVDPAPEPEPKPDPEPQPEPKPEPEPKKPVRLVPHEALHEERVKRRALEREIAEMRRPKPAADTQPQNEEIDETVNPLGAIGQLRARLKSYEEREAQATQAANQSREIITRMAPRIEAYTKEHPEYPEQFQYLRQSRATELKELGYSQEAISRQIGTEEMSLAHQTLESDRDPGDVIARLAIARGWKAKEPAKEEPKADPKPDPAAEKKIERLAAGQKVAKSPSAAGGSGPEAEMTLEHLASLDGAAFDAAFNKHGKRLMGG